MNILIIGDAEQKSSITLYTKTHLAQIKKIDPKAKITVSNDPKKINAELPSTEIIITSPMSQGLIDFNLTKNLKWIHFSSAGINAMDEKLKNSDILVTNSTGVHPIPISETVLGYILMFGRRLNVTYRNQIQEKKWVRSIEAMRGDELIGKTVGIIGFGNIGQEIAKICSAIGMNISILQHKQVHKVNKAYKVHKEIGDVLKKADFVVDCLPLTPTTKGYFDKKKFKLMKNSSYFINIGRGGTVVEKDLISALKSGEIAGAGLDVFEVEPLSNSSPLWKLNSVILTPHISGWTPEYTNRVINIFCTNLSRYLKGKPMTTEIDKNKGY